MYVGTVRLEQWRRASHSYCLRLLFHFKLHVHAPRRIDIDVHVLRNVRAKARHGYGHFINARQQFGEPIDASRIRSRLTRHSSRGVERLYLRTRHDGVGRISNISCQRAVKHLRTRGAWKNAQTHQQNYADKSVEPQIPANAIPNAQHRFLRHTPSTQVNFVEPTSSPVHPTPLAKLLANQEPFSAEDLPPGPGDYQPPLDRSASEAPMPLFPATAPCFPPPVGLAEASPPKIPRLLPPRQKEQTASIAW